MVRHHLEYSAQLRTPQFKKDTTKLEQIQRRTIRVIRRLETKSSEERLDKLSMSSLEKRRVNGDMIAFFKYLKDCPTEERQDLFLIIPECRT